MSEATETFAPDVATMAEHYPSLEFHLEERDGRPIAVWEGWLQPIRTRAGLNSIVSDLDEDCPVMIDRDTTTIGHYAKCGRQHGTHPILKKIKRWDCRFLVRIEYNGGPAHPAGYLLDPVITPATRRHIFGLNRMCAYAPWTDAWRVDLNTVAEFTGHILIWLFKWNIWVETGHWLGSEMDHRPLYLLSTIRRDMQCWCGSGVPYEGCCMPLDQRRASDEMGQMLQRRSRLRQKPDTDFSALRTLAAFLLPNKGRP
jgi:hypothetical protein